MNNALNSNENQGEAPVHYSGNIINQINADAGPRRSAEERNVYHQTSTQSGDPGTAKNKNKRT
ncbi:MAG: hypothetical protein JWL92_276 [Candidatus Nomurabacteria bacterium]|nr:hypothetical protein [Candidatus Nomurabacteria bacterium]